MHMNSNFGFCIAACAVALSFCAAAADRTINADYKLTEDEVVDGLRALLMGEELECTSLDSCTHTCTYEEGGYMTYDKGFTIHMADGSVYQITVKQER